MIVIADHLTYSAPVSYDVTSPLRSAVACNDHKLIEAAAAFRIMAGY